MIRPQNALAYEDIDLKLGIKSSLPSVRPTLALLFLMWRETGRPSEMEYAVSNGNTITMKPEIENALIEKLHSFDGTVSIERFREIINSNLMFKSQLEALLVAFELVWKLAKIRFSDGRSNSAERTGGARFPKKLWFTTNMDLLDFVCGSDADYEKIFFSWLGFRFDVNTEKEQIIIDFFTAISEGAYYKLIDGESDVIFNMESVYRAVLSQTDDVDIAGDNEAKGPLRVLKSALTENLFSHLNFSNGIVSTNDTVALQNYANRVAVYHQLSATPDLAVETTEVNADAEENKYSPQWFREKALQYPELDATAADLIRDFQERYSYSQLEALQGTDILHRIFLNTQNADNLCRVLEFGPQIKDIFGSIKGGNAYKYGLFYSSQGYWVSGSHQHPRQLNETEAIAIGTRIRDHLVAGAKAIEEFGELATIDDYKRLYQTLHTVTEGEINKVWFMKYYQMLYPNLFATNYSDFAQNTILAALGIEKEEQAFVRLGQLRFFANECGITNVMLNKIFWETYSEETATDDAENAQAICYNTGYQSNYGRNRILFGAPGTGKSFTLNREKDTLLANGGEYERVTFHPDYSYANFVGTYKPVPFIDNEGKDAITYAYVPGPFMRTYVKALKNSRTDAPKPYLLVIEEINRANVAAVFGDVFQLLDRDDGEASEYPIQASEDIKKYLAKELGGEPDDYSEIRIPDNMFIWATMNSADQGVFPMDTAFKRRWDFTYLGIDDSEDGIAGKTVILGEGEYRRVVEWNALRKAINGVLLTYKVNEDKLLGPYFIAKKNLPEGTTIDPVTFIRIFKNKVIMYLFDDAAKQKRPSLFAGCDERSKNQYSKICAEFDRKGVYIFCDEISSSFITVPTEDDEQ